MSELEFERKKMLSMDDPDFKEQMMKHVVETRQQIIDELPKAEVMLFITLEDQGDGTTSARVIGCGLGANDLASVADTLMERALQLELEERNAMKKERESASKDGTAKTV